jgi:hypothetical protein
MPSAIAIDWPPSERTRRPPPPGDGPQESVTRSAEAFVDRTVAVSIHPQHDAIGCPVE